LPLQRLPLQGEFVGRPTVLDLAVDAGGRIAVSGEVVDCARGVVIVQPVQLAGPARRVSSQRRNVGAGSEAVDALHAVEEFACARFRDRTGISSYTFRT
jgi:hypothetical protein